MRSAGRTCRTQNSGAAAPVRSRRRSDHVAAIQAEEDVNAMPKLLVDGKEVDVPAEYTLLQACEAAGAEIPRFCYHEQLSIASNCQICLIEVKGRPKPI